MGNFMAGMTKKKPILLKKKGLTEENMRENEGWLGFSVLML